jgi:hypothetical protein
VARSRHRRWAEDDEVGIRAHLQAPLLPHLGPAVDVTASSVATAATAVIACVDMVTVTGAGMKDLRNERRLYSDVLTMAQSVRRFSSVIVCVTPGAGMLAVAS